MGMGGRDLQQARLRTQQILPSQVTMATESTFRGRNGNGRFQTYYGDTFTESGVCSKRVEDVNDTLQ
jgi:hypothetical protein